MRPRTGGLTRLGDTDAFKAYLEQLRSKYASTRSTSDMPAPRWTPSGPTGPSGIPRPETCPECHFEVRVGQHGWLKTGRRVYDDKVGMVTDEMMPCPSCSGEELRRRRFERFRALMADARLPRLSESWTFASFPQSPDKLEALRDVATFARGGVSSVFTNLYLHGGFGTGKTGLAICVLRARLQQMQPGLFWTLPDLLTRIKATYDAGREESENALIAQLSEVDLLVLDDLGTEKPSDWQREKLYQIVNRRMNEDRETVFTSNLGLVQLEAHVGPRIVERIEYRCLPVEVGGANLRRLRPGVPAGEAPLPF